MDFSSLYPQRCGDDRTRSRMEAFWDRCPSRLALDTNTVLQQEYEKSVDNKKRASAEMLAMRREQVLKKSKKTNNLLQ